MISNYYENLLQKFNEDRIKNGQEALKYKIQTYGCQMNEHDSEQAEFVLKNAGLTASENIEDADIILINTCAIRGTAENKVYGFLGLLKGMKAEDPHKKIIVSGCMPQLEDSLNKMKSSYENVDIFMGTANYNKLAELIMRSIDEKNQITDISSQYDLNSEELNYERLYSHKSFVNIMYGCNNFCSYCVVPYTRGREQSRNPEEIVSEIQKLAKDGVKEVTLLGQNVNSYGKTLKEKITFSELLAKINEINGIERIRFMTSHPKDISEELIDSYGKLEKLSNHLHLPVQSGSNRILEKMHRKYNREKYMEIVNSIRKKYPDIALSTDIMVGFPGETEEDFNDTLDLVKKCRFDFAFTFLFSKRPGTPAYKMEAQIDPKIKTERFNRLTEAINEISLELNQKYIGKTVSVLADEISKKEKEYLSGRTDTFKLVNFKGKEDLIGKMVNVKITNCNTFSLEGELV